MEKEINNFAFIDGQNLYLNILSQGWRLDYQKFRILLTEKYGVKNAYIFIGYLDNRQALYKDLQEKGYIVIFKPTLIYTDGKTKGNCDAELVLHSMIEINNYNKAVIVSGDGDFYCLIEYLRNLNKLEAVLIPNSKSYSALLKKTNTQREKFLYFLNEMKTKIEYLYKRKGPYKDKTL